MNDDTTDAQRPAKPSSSALPWHLTHDTFTQFGRSWLIPALALAGALLVLAFYFPPKTAGNGSTLGPVLDSFSALHENLPLTLPILSACLSIMLNIREILKPQGWLRLPTPLALGLVSFAIWYVVAAQSTSEQYIPIGSGKVLSRDYAVILIVVSFIWAAFAALGRVLGEMTSEDGRGLRWQVGQALLLFVSFVGLFVPFYLFEPKAQVETRLNRALDESYFSVSIPFRDPSLNQHLGRTTDPVTQCIVYRQVRAKRAADAVEEARRSFLASDLNRLQYAKPKDGSQRPGNVEIVEAWIIAEKEPGMPRLPQPAATAASSAP